MATHTTSARWSPSARRERYFDFTGNILPSAFESKMQSYNCSVPAMSSTSRQQFSWHDWNQWHLGVLPLLLLFGALLLYMFAAQRAVGWSSRRTIAFIAGLIVTFLATQSVIGTFDMEYFSDHMIQHLML